MGYSRSVRRNLLDHFFGHITYVPPASVYVGVSSTLPTSQGNNVTEPGGNYVRQLTQTADWNVATDADPAVISNINPVAFPTANIDWASGADISYAVLYDAESGGNFLGFGAFARGKPVYSGDTLSIAAGKLLIGLV